MSAERHILESAMQTLRGEIARVTAARPVSPCYGGRWDIAWHRDGMEHALSILEGMAYEFIQMEIEASQP